jgi:hypothetical protein
MFLVLIPTVSCVLLSVFWLIVATLAVCLAPSSCMMGFGYFTLGVSSAFFTEEKACNFKMDLLKVWEQQEQINNQDTQIRTPDKHTPAAKGD